MKPTSHRYIQPKQNRAINPATMKPCELHNVFNAMVASTRKQKTIPTSMEKKKMPYQGKTPEQHLTDAKAMTLFGIKVLDEIPRKVGAYWQLLIECERCGTKKWISKNDLTRTKSCGCLKPSNAKPKIEPFELAGSDEIMEGTLENKKKIALPKDDFKAFEENFKKINSSHCDSNREQNEQNEKNADRVCVSRRLVMGLADETKKAWADEDFWEMSPAVFNALIQDTKEIYEALRGK